MGHCLSQYKKDDDDSDHVEFAGGNVQLITTKEKWDERVSEAKKAGKIVIANFSASWCGPCRMIAPFYVELSEKYPSLMFLTVDVDELTEFSTSLDIKATPTFFFLRDGEQFDKLVGANKPELQNKVIANFSASWCGPCRMIAPFYVELSEKYPSLMFLTVDVDELTEFSTSLDIKATPTFFFLRDGEQFDKLVGANKPELQNKVTAIADKSAPI